MEDLPAMKHRHVADRLGGVIPSGLMEMLKLGENLAAQGKDIVFLAQGEPDFDTPHHIKQVGADVLRNEPALYAPPMGIMPLREAVAAKLERHNGIRVAPAKEVIITPGATMGLFVALMATVNPGDEVLTFDPGFGPYLSMIGLLGAKAVLVPTREVDGQLRPDPQEVESRITPRSRVLLVNTPFNPTGVVLTEAELVALGEVAERHDLLIFSDEVYEEIIYEPHTHISIGSLAPELRERTVTINSLSKTYAMTGWRVGYISANPALVAAMGDVMQLSGRCVPMPIQRAAIRALSGPQECVAEMREQYARRRMVLVEGLNAIPGIRCAAPEATFYTFPDTSAIDPDSWRLARALIEQAGVVTSPGRHYGPNGEGHLRISFATSIEKIQAGLQRIAEAVPQLQAVP
jgi:aspartate/methionine/tyrosine aminotransferase